MKTEFQYRKKKYFLWSCIIALTDILHVIFSKKNNPKTSLYLDLFAVERRKVVETGTLFREFKVRLSH